MRLPLLVALGVLAAAPAWGQSRAETEARLAGLRQQVSGVERQVRRTRTEETSALRALEGLDAEIVLRQQLVEGYQSQTDAIRGETRQLRRSIERLEAEVEAAKASYRGRARHAYMHGRRNALALILAAGSVNQMIVRARYLQQFAKQRRGEVERIAETSTALQAQERAVQASLAATEKALRQGRTERDRLAARRRDRAGLVAELRTKRGRLERELDQRRSDAQQLAGLVRELVVQEERRAEEERRRQEAARQAEAARVAERRAEAERQAELARQAEVQRRADEAARRAAEARAFRRQPEPRNPEPAPPQPEAAPPAPRPSEPVAEARPSPRPEAPRPEPPRPEPRRPAPRPAPRPEPVAEARPAPRAEPAADLTGSFRQNRGRLPRPAAGTVVGRFGKRTDPAYGTSVTSIGIDIATAPGAPARAVFDGVVERVGTMATYGTFVMVSHGGYTTIYGNLSGVSVRQGQRVQAGQAVGRAGTAASRRGSQLFFALFQGGEAVDPSGWLR